MNNEKRDLTNTPFSVSFIEFLLWGTGHLFIYRYKDEQTPLFQAVGLILTGAALSIETFFFKSIQHSDSFILFALSILSYLIIFFVCWIWYRKYKADTYFSQKQPLLYFPFCPNCHRQYSLSKKECNYCKIPLTIPKEIQS